jgi:hypothetical protein
MPALMMDAVHISEKSAYFYETVRRYFLEDCYKHVGFVASEVEAN